MSESDTPAGGYRYEVIRPAQSPAPIEKLDSLCAASMIAHEAVYELHRRLYLVGTDSKECAALLAESAQITTKEIPDTVASARKLARRWSDEAIIHPEAARKTLTELSAAVEECQPTLRSLLCRQQTIAAALRSRLGTGAPD